MKCGEPRRNRANLRHARLSVGHHPIQHRVFVEAAHPDRPLDHVLAPGRRRAGRAQFDFAVAAAPDRHDVEIDVGRKAPIKPDFFETQLMAPVESAGVEKRKPDRLLYLVNVVAGEEHV